MKGGLTLTILKTSTIIEEIYLYTYVVKKDGYIPSKKISTKPISKSELVKLIKGLKSTEGLGYEDDIWCEPKSTSTVDKSDWVLVGKKLYPPKWKACVEESSTYASTKKEPKAIWLTPSTALSAAALQSGDYH
ncbi:hypothetical protein N8654_03230 [Synechococcus sp. AH-601-B19]|nr:hypothetical protein [Synechococcus sp. AH-601-B19]